MNLIVKNDLFDYKNRYIYQMKDGFRFSIDSILLAEYTSVINARSILDICTGNAVVPLILSLKTNASIVSFEIQEEIYKLAIDSIKLNNLDSQVTIINDDIKNISKYYNNKYFDIITCNPPYYKDSNKCKNELETIARHEVCITLEDIFSIASKYLNNNGIFYLVHRVSRLDEIIYLGVINNLRVKEVQLVSTKREESPNIVLVKCIKNSKNGIKVNNIICVDKLSSYQHIFEGELKNEW